MLMADCPLNRRELQVLEMLGSGETENKVEFDLARTGANPTRVFRDICVKARVATLTAAGMLAVAKGWVTVPEPLPIDKPPIDNPLTIRERMALRNVLDGANAPEVARRMDTTVTAVQDLWNSARRKIDPNVRATPMAARLARQWGWLND